MQKLFPSNCSTENVYFLPKKELTFSASPLYGGKKEEGRSSHLPSSRNLADEKRIEATSLWKLLTCSARERVCACEGERANNGFQKHFQRRSEEKHVELMFLSSQCQTL